LPRDTFVGDAGAGLSSERCAASEHETVAAFTPYDDGEKPF
jgi:hypothetical protein